MKKTRVLGLIGSATLILGLFVILPGMGADEKDKDSKDTLYRPLGLYTEVLSLVRSNYVEPVELKPLLSGSFSGMTEAMDPFSEYVPPDKMPAFNAYLAAKDKKDTLDVGIVLAKKFGYPVVVSAIAGSPAAAAGIRSDDIVEKIDDQPARTLAIWEVDAKLSGKAGGRVRLLVVREGKPRHRTIDIVRGSWTPQGPSSARVEGETVVKVPTFVAGTTAALKAILAPLDRTRPLLIDLRGNALGSFDEASRAASLFVPAGPLGELKGRKIEGRTFKAEPGERVHESRLIVLVDSGTAGAAELFASALHDASARSVAKAAATATAAAAAAKGPMSGAPDEDDSAIPDGAPVTPAPPSADRPVRLVGEPTVGMGFTAQTVKLASGGTLKISVGKIHTLSGKSLSPKGLQPDDRVFPLPPEEGKPPVDLILQRGLKLLAKSPA